MIYTSSQIKASLEPIFLKYGVRSAILFGSYAKGLQTDNSDVDILVDSGLRGLAFFGLLEEITDTLGKAVDLLDVSQVKPDSRIDEAAKKEGIKLYG